jgi:hypothetical protein
MKNIFVAYAISLAILAFLYGCAARDDISVVNSDNILASVGLPRDSGYPAKTTPTADPQSPSAVSPASPSNVAPPSYSPTALEPATPEENISPEILAVRAIKVLGAASELNSVGAKISGNLELTEVGNYLYDVDLNGDKVVDELHIDVSEMDVDPNDGYNHPIHIALRVGKSELSWDDEWNDGVIVEPIDFDVSDGYVEIFYYSSGTDIDGGATLIRYNGAEFQEYTGFGVMCGYVLYDAIGTIYYLAPYTDDDGHYVAIMEFKLSEQTKSVYAKFEYQF